MLRHKSLYAISLILIAFTVNLQAAPMCIQLAGWPLHASESENCNYALGIVGSYLPGSCEVQFAPGYSISETVEGIQVGGVFSICRTLPGTQLSTGFNICSENRGLQIAGVFNRCYLLEGRQIGIINSAAEGKGTQIGVFNYGGKGNISSIGLINIRKSGILRWLTSLDHKGDIFTGLQSGGEHLYTALFLGVSDQSSSFAVGRHLRAARFFCDTEAGLFIPSGIQKATELSALARVRPGFSVTRSLNLFTSFELRIGEGYSSSALGSVGIAWGR